MTSRSQRLMYALGYAGLTPFLAFTLGVWFLDNYLAALSLRGFIVYSLAILCFLGGTLWGSAMHRPNTAKLLRLVISNGIVVFAVIAVLVAQPVVCAFLLMLGQLATLWYERSSSEHSGWYLQLRSRLTTIAVGLHLLFMIGLVIRNGV
ncbi:MAG: DUF3429 domain-containing protein [Halieaceae bacterium]